MSNSQFPKSSVVLRYLQIIFFAGLLLYLGRSLFIPLFFGLLIAIVMYPVARWLEKKGFNKSIAIALCLLVVATLFAALIYLLIWQINVFRNESGVLLVKLEAVLKQLQIWINENTGISVNIIDNWESGIGSSLGGLLKGVLQATVSTLFVVFMVPVFMVLFLYHRQVLVQFLRVITPPEYREQLNNILQQTILTYYRYIRGMVLVYLLVGVLNSIGLWALGVPHPLLFGMICAVMTIIPYAGIIISALLPVSMVWLQTDNVLYPLAVIAVFAVVQYLEANIIFPRVVGGQLNVSTLVMLMSIIAGGIIWGGAGMVLFIPFVAMLKIVSDQLPEWRPLSFLLGR
ncbi:MAG: AI-2E family transporter [Chitinophagaceae bacterium]|nr:AI-2E family transporter [Chitinophagaceae bacterium]MCW5929006.1 AI-2E family transporter [Chitinophagaceae bacterium]